MLSLKRSSRTQATEPARIALVQGASRGLGLAMVAQLLADGRYAHVYATCRRPADAPELRDADSTGRLTILGLNLCEPETIADAAHAVGEKAERLDLLVNCSGILFDDEGMWPEKRLADVDAAAVSRAFQVNALGALLVAREFKAVLERGSNARFAAVSARVGSIGDNRKGGWYAYRASKAALNMMIRTLAIEWARLPRPIACFSLHPGTVETDLSLPFRRQLPLGQAVPVDRAAARLLKTLEDLAPEQTGGFFAYDGSAIEW